MGNSIGEGIGLGRTKEFRERSWCTHQVKFKGRRDAGKAKAGR